MVYFYICMCGWMAGKKSTELEHTIANSIVWRNVWMNADVQE